MKKFEIHVPESVLADLRQRLEKTRLPDQINGAGWGYGTDLDYLGGLIEYWRTDFDWRAQERLLNRFDHYIDKVDGLDMHFIHMRSKHEDATPMLVSHGWPGSVFEFYKIIEPLVDPESHGGQAADAFHVVCPSLPGYGWSEAPHEPGFDIQQVGAWGSKLMAALGYDRFVAQGGDWGSMASIYIGRDNPAHCMGVHLNMVVGFPPADDPNAFEGLSEQELANLNRMTNFFKTGAAYQQIQGTKPQTLGYSLNDSPAGLCAWILEKLWHWSDCDGHPENAFTRDELLTNVMIYWVTGSITSSMRLYTETLRSGLMASFEGRVDVPVAGAVFPYDVVTSPRKWAEQRLNIQQWTAYERGGHFAALEVPEVLVEDIRRFGRLLRVG